MKKRLAHVSPLQCGIVLAVLYVCISLLIVPFFLLASIIAAHTPQNLQQPNPFASLGLVFVVLIPILYGIAGFIGGVIAAAIYNLVARMTGGIEFTTVDVSLGSPPPITYPAN